MKITVIEWYKAADRDCCLIDLAENNLPTESKTELRKVLVLGMDIEIDGIDYKLRGIDAYATDHIPGGKVGLWVEKQYNWADVTINLFGVELKGITGMKFEQPLNFGNDFLRRHISIIEFPVIDDTLKEHPQFGNYNCSGEYRQGPTGN